MTTPLLKVKNLSVSFKDRTTQKNTPAIKHIDFHLNHQETLGIVGESGSGKSLTLLSILGLVDTRHSMTSGEIFLDDNNLANLSEKEYRKIRGKEISITFQNAKLAFNPYYSIGHQITEMIRLHTSIKNKRDAKERAIEWLARVKMEAPAVRYHNNPYGLSGGMCQRAMIAMALASQPRLLLADEPTSGLDATLQSSIINLLRTLSRDSGTSMIVVSHNFNVIRQLTDRVMVYYQGRVIEQGYTRIFFDESRTNIHPYTKRLLSSSLYQPINPVQQNHIHQGCEFFSECPEKNTELSPQCENKMPPLFPTPHGHEIRCWKYQP